MRDGLDWSEVYSLDRPSDVVTMLFGDGRGDVATFAPTDLYTLIDSPIFAGAHYRRVDIDLVK